MYPIKSFTFPDIPTEISEKLFRDEKQMIIVGVIGKSSTLDCNKMVGFNILNIHPALTDSDPQEGKIKFYYGEGGNVIYLHFETTFDNQIMANILEKTGHLSHFVAFNSYIRTRFARILLFAIQVCHVIVMVDTGTVFDASYLSIFKSLKIIREKYVLKFLPKLLKNSNAGSFMGKEGRLCSPRFIFFFEGPIAINSGDEENLKKMEFAVEDSIYKMLRNEFIITNNSAMSLFSIPRNKRFVFFNTDKSVKSDPVLESIEMLMEYLDKPQYRDEEEEEFLNELRPYKGYAKPWHSDTKKDDKLEKKERSLVNLLKEHIDEAFELGFDDSMSKYRGRSHFVIPAIKSWYDAFKLLHRIFIENPDNPEFEANDPDYKAYLQNFHKLMDIDEKFFSEVCDHGLELAMINYKEMLPHHYSSTFHEQKHQQALNVFLKYARGPELEAHEIRLKDFCDSTWLNGKQQCEYPSLRGNPCALAKHKVTDPTEHSSGVVFISTCNCGRTQGHREDPYTIRQANYDFYQILAKSCSNCNKLEKITFPVFEPSINDFRAAEFNNRNISNLMSFENSSKTPETGTHGQTITEHSPHLSASQNSQKSSSNLTFSLEENADEDKKKYNNSDDGELGGTEAEENDVNEIVIKVGEYSEDEEKEKNIMRQPSTTEYLPGMLHTSSPVGLLPQFPSWSLVCIGPSSIYSHNTGLPEHVQSGFLSGANFLLPWDVNVRLEHAQSWAASYEKIRNRKKGLSSAKQVDSSNNFNLKIFVGTEYECLRGHRFIMSSPETILRGGSGINRDSGSKIVFNDMPIYFPCPCRTTPPSIAQLMRVHVVTPKAPVNVILEPKVKINNLVFTTGVTEPIKLSQSTYWIVRLPYIYEGDDGPILPPLEMKAATAKMHGVLMAGMYGIKESEVSEDY